MSFSSTDEYKNCVMNGDRTVPRDQIFLNIKKAARGFHDLGLREDDAVAIFMRNDFAFLEATEGASQLGAYVVPINFHFKSDEFRYILEDSKAKIIVGHADLLAGVRDIIPQDMPVLVVPTPPPMFRAYNIPPELARIPEGALVWEEWLETLSPWTEDPRTARTSMMYTSGTTGRPKGVRRAPATPEQAAARTKLFRDVYCMEPGVRGLIPGPLYHSSPNPIARRVLQIGEFLYLMPRFDAEEMLALIERYRITNVMMVPTMFVRLLKLPEEVRRKYDVSSLRRVSHNAEPCPVGVKKAMIDWWGPIINEVYGGTETGIPLSITSEEWLSHPGSVGRPTPGTRLVIYDEDGKPVPPGGVGEVYVHCNAYSDFVYMGDEKKTKAAMRDGLITIGDLGYMKDGFLYLCDRKTDMVKSGGVAIYTAEIEAVLKQSPKIQDCAVFGVPDEDFGEALMAAVKLEPCVTMTAEEVKQFVAERLAKYKVPKHVTFHEELPREDNGKIYKRKLRQPHWEKTGRSI
jgi:long-chain acyl-CoA synthetase